MKISKLHIDQFRHLENLTFDFTYQSGERKGQPLDKICFIGQSATGKTSLLDLIYDQTEYASSLEIVNGHSLWAKRKFNLKGETAFVINQDIFIQNENEVTFKNKVYKENSNGGSITYLIPANDRKKDILYLKVNLITDKNIDFFDKNPIELLEKHHAEIQNNQYKENYGIVFDENINTQTWLYLLYEILDYRKNFTQKMSELIHKGLLADYKKLDNEFKKWQKNNPNKLEDFADKFNPILNKLHLEIDLVNTEFAIPIKNKTTDNIIPIQNTSTGTKGLLLSFVPVFKLDLKDSILLIDEPERSLYPDIQMEILDHYKNVAPDTQIIVATHSPFIAASFEADERFILYFDNEGKVAVRRGSSPIGDDPNDMLKNDFGVNYYNKFGEDAYKKYLSLKEELAKEKDPVKKKELLLETVKLGDTYNF